MLCLLTELVNRQLHNNELIPTKVLSENHSEIHKKVEVEQNQFTTQQIQDLASSFIFQLLNEVGLYNFNECIFYLYEILYRLSLGISRMSGQEYWEGSREFTHAFHVGPLAYKQCINMQNEYEGVLKAYEVFIWKDWKNTVSTYISNIVFNAIDIYYESIDLAQGFDEEDWTKVGTFSSKIFADIFFKSPLMIQWHYKNSEVISREVDHQLQQHQPKVSHSLTTRDDKLSQLNECMKNKEFQTDFELSQFIENIDHILLIHERSESKNNYTEFDQKLEQLLAKNC